MEVTKRRSVKKTGIKKKNTKPLLKNIPDVYPVLGGMFTTPKKAKPEPHTKTFGSPPKKAKSPTPKRKTPTPKRKTPTPKRKSPPKATAKFAFGVKTGVNYQKMTVVQLKDELRKQKKPLTGKKADLVARLMENGGQVGVKRKSPVKEKRKKPVNPSPIRLRPEEERAYNGYSVGRLRKMLTERKIEGRSKLTTRKKITERLVQWDREQV